MKLSQVKPSDSRASSFLFIGPQGSGKTIAACSFPNPRLWDVEGKTESLINWYNQPQYREYLDKIDLEVVNDVFNFINTTIQDMVERGSSKGTEIIDSITTISRDVVNAVLKSRVSSLKAGKGAGDRAKIVPGNIIVPSWDEYDAEDTVFGTLMGMLFTIQKRYEINIVCLAHPHSTSGPNGKNMDKIVCKGHKAPQTILNYFNEVYHFQKDYDFSNETTQYTAITKGGTYSRTAWPFLPDKLDFTNRPFYEVLKEKLDEHYNSLEVSNEVEDKPHYEDTNSF